MFKKKGRPEVRKLAMKMLRFINGRAGGVERRPAGRKTSAKHVRGGRCRTAVVVGGCDTTRYEEAGNGICSTGRLFSVCDFNCCALSLASISQRAGAPSVLTLIGWMVT